MGGACHTQGKGPMRAPRSRSESLEQLGAEGGEQESGQRLQGRPGQADPGAAGSHAGLCADAWLCLSSFCQRSLWPEGDKRGPGVYGGEREGWVEGVCGAGVRPTHSPGQMAECLCGRVRAGRQRPRSDGMCSGPRHR